MSLLGSKIKGHRQKTAASARESVEDPQTNHELGQPLAAERWKLAINLTGGLVALAVAGLIAATAAAASGPPKQTSNPTLQPGQEASVGDTLSISNGGWSGNPTSYSYQWKRCDPVGDRQNCVTIQGATSQSYKVRKADVNHKLDAIVTATNADGSASSDASSDVIADAAPPTNKTRPAISGSASVGSTLSTNNGSWLGATSFSYAWQQCDQNGNKCATISGATGKTYGVRSADVGHELRVQVTAQNKYGSARSDSNLTAVVTSNTTTATVTTPPPAGSTITVDKVSLPDRLIVDKLSFSPNPTRTRGPIVARFHVSDTQGHSIHGALVYALGLPYSWLRHATETPTDAGGWATISLQPTAAMPLHRGGALVVFVRARKPGDNLLAGVSTRRLVQEGISR